MAVGCALPDDHDPGSLSLPKHNVQATTQEREPESKPLLRQQQLPIGWSILLPPADEVPGCECE